MPKREPTAAQLRMRERAAKALEKAAQRKRLAQEAEGTSLNIKHNHILILSHIHRYTPI